MKNKLFASLTLALLSTLNAELSTLHAQGPAFTYQGRLNDSGGPANGSYDLQFAIFAAAAGGSPIGGALTANAVAVSNGLFTVTLDFGAGVFTGADRWLNLSVKTNGAGSFTPLTPRQQITSAPYAVQALGAGSAATVTGNVSASQITGTVQLAQLPGTILTNSQSGVTLSGTFTGNGAGLTALNAAQLTGTVPLAQLPGTVLTNNQNGVNLNGTFAGNGAGLTNLPGAFTWHVVAGTTQQTQPNNGYIATNTAQVTITLPPAPAIGDAIRVSGSGTGGWKVAQNAGQSILIANAAPLSIGVTWVARDNNREWRSVASSADGIKLVAVVGGNAVGQIYTSADSGATWTARESKR